MQLQHVRKSIYHKVKTSVMVFLSALSLYFRLVTCTEYTVCSSCGLKVAQKILSVTRSSSRDVLYCRSANTAVFVEPLRRSAWLKPPETMK